MTEARPLIGSDQASDAKNKESVMSQDSTKNKGVALEVLAAREDWALLRAQCNAFLASGFLPDHVWKDCNETQALAKALTIATKGRELGIPPLQAFSSITVIKGKPCLSSELMLALVYQRVKGAKVTFRTPIEKQNEECTVEMQRPGGEPMQFRFTIQDARNAGMQFKDSKGNPTAWAKYPAAMLRARAISAGARAVFPDCIMGAYTPEEMGADVIDVEDLGVVQTMVPEMPSTPPTPGTDKRGFPHGEYPPSNPNWEKEPCTEPQQKRLWAMCKEKGVERDELLFEMFGADCFNQENKPSAKGLTKGEIKQVFKRLETYPNVGGGS
jgi:hypothetical protein